MPVNNSLTIENWKSEYQRLETRFIRLGDPMSLEGKGLLDHMHAVKLILADLGETNYPQDRNSKKAVSQMKIREE